MYLLWIGPSIEADVHNVMSLIEMDVQLAASCDISHHLRARYLVVFAFLEELEIKRPFRRTRDGFVEAIIRLGENNDRV